MSHKISTISRIIPLDDVFIFNLLHEAQQNYQDSSKFSTDLDIKYVIFVYINRALCAIVTSNHINAMQRTLFGFRLQTSSQAGPLHRVDCLAPNRKKA